MRKMVIGGNWKMHLGTPESASDMLNELIPLVKNIDNVDIIVFPPFTALTSTNILKKTNIKFGGQNMYFEEKGAYTGEISPDFLKSFGCEHVILGHSERRTIFKETDNMINKKINKAIESNLKPIVCIGENLKQRKEGITKKIIEEQFKNTFKDLSKKQIKDVIIAYEPIWAIGTGETATPQQAEEVHVHIRDLISQQYDEKISEDIRIQYGGSIKPQNAEDLFSQKNIDGGLVGGASLDAKSFYQIIKAAGKISK